GSPRQARAPASRRRVDRGATRVPVRSCRARRRAWRHPARARAASAAQSRRAWPSYRAQRGERRRTPCARADETIAMWKRGRPSGQYNSRHMDAVGRTSISPSARANQRNAVLAGFLGWTLDAFDFFVLTFVVQDIATAFGKPRAVIAATVGLALITRPIGALVFGLIADRYGRRLPLMLNVIFYAFISVLCGLAPNYATFAALRLLFGIGMGGEWGVGASLALESVSPRLRGLLSGLLQEGYALGNLLAALAYRSVYVSVHASHPDYAWRVMFFIGGLPALLSLFIRARVRE